MAAIVEKVSGGEDFGGVSIESQNGDDKPLKH
jgi:hypothetical protein